MPVNDRSIKPGRPSSPQPEEIRRYSMAWLLRAACRVSERGVKLYDEHRRQLRQAGVNALFDLSDQDHSGNFSRLR